MKKLIASLSGLTLSLTSTATVVNSCFNPVDTVQMQKLVVTDKSFLVKPENNENEQLVAINELINLIYQLDSQVLNELLKIAKEKQNNNIKNKLFTKMVLEKLGLLTTKQWKDIAANIFKKLGEIIIITVLNYVANNINSFASTYKNEFWVNVL